MHIAIIRLFLTLILFSSFININSILIAQTGGEWITKSSMPTARKEISNAAIAIDGKIYVVGGVSSDGNITDKLERFDPATNTWETMSPVPNNIWRASAATSGGKLYVFGGYQSTSGFPFNPTNRVFEYDPSNDTWAEKSSMSTARGTSVAVEVSGKIHVIGGAASDALSLHEVYDPSNDSWESKASMTTARSGLTGVALEGKIFLVGGYFLSGGVVSQKVLEVYDPSNNSWTSKTSMPISRHGIASVVVNNRMYVFGGSTDATITSRSLEYDPISDAWRQVADLPSAVSFMGVAAVRDTIYVMGGGPVDLNTTDGLSLNSAFIPPTIVTSTEDEGSLPKSFELKQNYPNPFNPVTNIRYTLSRSGKVNLAIHDILGEEVTRLVNEFQSAGEYQARWDASDFSSGVYFYRLAVGDLVQTKKMLLLK